MNTWIDIRNKLPDAGARVLACATFEHHDEEYDHIEIATFMDDGRWYIGGEDYLERVTHWRSIPDPPSPFTAGRILALPVFTIKKKETKCKCGAKNSVPIIEDFVEMLTPDGEPECATDDDGKTWCAVATVHGLKRRVRL